MEKSMEEYSARKAETFREMYEEIPEWLKPEKTGKGKKEKE